MSSIRFLMLLTCISILLSSSISIASPLDPHKVDVILQEMEKSIEHLQTLLVSLKKEAGLEVSFTDRVMGQENDLPAAPSKLAPQVKKERVAAISKKEFQMPDRLKEMYLEGVEVIDDLKEGETALFKAYNDAHILYDHALDLIHQDNFVEAKKALNYLLKNFSEHPIIPSAFFWLSNVSYLSHNYPLAVKKLEQYLSFWPSHEKISVALLNLFHAYTFMGEASKAQEYRAKLLEQFPSSREAEIVRLAGR